MLSGFASLTSVGIDDSEMEKPDTHSSLSPRGLAMFWIKRSTTTKDGRGARMRVSLVGAIFDREEYDARSIC